jgi:cell wall-associated NlpC family hydrolase
VDGGTRSIPARPRAGRTALRPAVTAIVTAAALGLTPLTAQAAPPAPGDAQVTDVVAAAEGLAKDIGRLTADAAAAQEKLDGAHATAAMALDGYQAAQAAYELARARSDAAAASAARASALLRAARADVVAFARHSYMQGTTDSRTTALIMSGDPSQLIERAALLEAAGNHRVTVFDKVAVAQEQAARSQVVARSTVAEAERLQGLAARALSDAQAAETRARADAAALLTHQIGLDRQLSAARTRLIALVGDRAATDLLAHLVPSPIQVPTSPAPGFPDDRPLAGPGLPAVASAAIDAAVASIGTPYAWGGGGARGPGPGVPPDRGVIGFDCSGLTQYAYARAGVSIPRNSRAQFTSLPRVPVADLQPGDLVFWATDPGDPRTIHHVALYLGQGRVLQAPESGDIVMVSTMWWTGYAGAGRPTG